MFPSIQIEPCASLVNTVRAAVPRLLLNRHAVGPFQKTPLRRGDYMELGDLEVTVRRFAELLEWSGDIEELMRTRETQVRFPLHNCTSQNTHTHAYTHACALGPKLLAERTELKLSRRLV